MEHPAVAPPVSGSEGHDSHVRQKLHYRKTATESQLENCSISLWNDHCRNLTGVVVRFNFHAPSFLRDPFLANGRCAQIKSTPDRLRI